MTIRKREDMVTESRAVEMAQPFVIFEVWTELWTIRRLIPRFLEYQDGVAIRVPITMHAMLELLKNATKLACNGWWLMQRWRRRIDVSLKQIRRTPPSVRLPGGGSSGLVARLFYSPPFEFIICRYCTHSVVSMFAYSPAHSIIHERRKKCLRNRRYCCSW